MWSEQARDGAGGGEAKFLQTLLSIQSADCRVCGAQASVSEDRKSPTLEGQGHLWKATV